MRTITFDLNAVLVVLCFTYVSMDVNYTTL